MVDSELLHCPFCGFPPQHLQEGGFHTVVCTHYYCQASQIALQSKTKAIERWNSRATLKSAEGEK